MNRRTTLALLLVLVSVLVPNVARADDEAGLATPEIVQTLHGIDREGDIPLP